MTVAKNKVIGISYTLFDGQGNLLEDNEGYAPILYLHGRGNIIQELETALEGLKVGDVKEVGINKNLPTVPIDSEEESSLPLSNKLESESLLYKVRVVLVRDSTLAEINSGFPLPESWCSQQPGCC